MVLYKMANNTTWQVSHFLCIVGHIGLIATGIVTFVIDGFNGKDYTAVALSGAAGGIVSLVFNHTLWPPRNPGGTDKMNIMFFNLYLYEMLMICTLQGIFGTGLNGLVFFYMLRLQNQPSDVTEDTQYLRRKLALTTSLLIQISLVIADIAIAGVIAGKIYETHLSTSVVILAVIAGSAVPLYYGILRSIMA